MTDYTSIKRTEWLQLAVDFYQSLDDEMVSLSPREWNRRSPYLGWRCRDVLAHMTSAIPVNFRQVLDRALQGNAGPPPEFNTLARNAREVAKRWHRPIDELLGEFRQELDSILSIYRHMTEEDWLRPAWFFVGPVNVRTLFLVQLGDNLFHKRDLLLVNGRWQGFDTEIAAPLVDWFLRELRPANFRPERAAGLEASVLYQLKGAGGGEWTFMLGGGECRAVRGAAESPDIRVTAGAEDLVAAGQARPTPVVGTLARVLSKLRPPEEREDYVAAVTGRASLAGAIVGRRLRISGNRSLVTRLNHAFWHFWERTEQTEHNISLDREQ